MKSPIQKARLVLLNLQFLFLCLLVFEHPVFAQKTELVLPLAHFAKILALSYSDDGNFLATGDEKGVLKIWETVSGRQICSLEVPEKIVKVAFSSDTKTIYAAGVTGTIRSFDLQTRRLLNLTELNLGNNSAITYNRDLSLAAVGDGGWVLVYEVKGKRVKLSERGHSSGVSGLAFNSNSRLLASTEFYGDNRTKLWDLESGRQLFQLPMNDKAEVLEFSRNNEFLAVSTYNSVKLFRTSDGKQIKIFKSSILSYGKKISLLFFTEDGKNLLASIPANNQIIGWDLETGKEFDLLGGKKLSASLLAFNPKGATLAAADGNRIQFWNSKENLPNEYFIWKRTESFLKLSPDKSRLLLAGQKGTLQILNLTNGKLTDLSKSRYYDSASSRQFTFSNDNSQIAAFYAHSIGIWNAKSGELIRSFEACDSRADDYVAFTSDDKLLLCYGSNSYPKNYSVKVFDAATGDELWKKVINSSENHGTVFSSDGKTVISRWGEVIELLGADIYLLSELGKGLKARGLGLKLPEGVAGDKLLVEIFKTENIYSLKSSWGESERINRLLESVWAGVEVDDIPTTNGGYYFLNAIKIWDSQTGRELQSYSEGGIHDFAISRDDKFLAIVWESVTEKFNRISIYEMKTGKKLNTWKTGRWTDVDRFSLDNRYLRTYAESGGNEIVYEIATGKETLKKQKFYDDGEILLKTGKSGEAQFILGSTDKELGNLLMFDKEWIFRTPDGIYEATPKILDSLYAVKGTQIVNADKLKRERFKKNLAAKVFGLKNKPEIEK